jgi:hypothetical protein
MAEYTQEESEISIAFTQDFIAIWERAKETNFADLVAAYNALEEAYLPKMTNSPFLALHTKRVIAEQILSSAVDKKRSFEECQQLLNNVSTLGFTNLRHKSTIFINLANYYRDIAPNGKVIELLKPLKAELEQELARTNQDFYCMLLYAIDNLMHRTRCFTTSFTPRPV